MEVGVKENIEKLLKLYTNLKPIFYTKEKTVTADGQVSIKEDYITAAKKFNIIDDKDNTVSQKLANDLIKEAKIEICEELKAIVKILLEEYGLFNKVKHEFDNLKPEDHLKTHTFCFRILLKLEVISPYEIVHVEPLIDSDESVLGIKKLAEEKAEDE